MIDKKELPPPIIVKNSDLLKNNNTVHGQVVEFEHRSKSTIVSTSVPVDNLEEKETHTLLLCLGPSPAKSSLFHFRLPLMRPSVRDNRYPLKEKLCRSLIVLLYF